MRYRGCSSRLMALAGTWKDDLGPCRHMIPDCIYEGEPNFPSDESEGCTVGLSVLGGNEAGQSLEGNRGGGSLHYILHREA